MEGHTACPRSASGPLRPVRQEECPQDADRVARRRVRPRQYPQRDSEGISPGREDARTAYGKYPGAQEQVRAAEEAARQITAKYECIFKQKILEMYRDFERSIMPQRTYCSRGRDSDSP